MLIYTLLGALCIFFYWHFGWVNRQNQTASVIIERTYRQEPQPVDRATVIVSNLRSLSSALLVYYEESMADRNLEAFIQEFVNTVAAYAKCPQVTR